MHINVERVNSVPADAEIFLWLPESVSLLSYVPQRDEEQ
jgi:hypothetical protein